MTCPDDFFELYGFDVKKPPLPGEQRPQSHPFAIVDPAGMVGSRWNLDMRALVTYGRWMDGAFVRIREPTTSQVT